VTGGAGDIRPIRRLLVANRGEIARRIMRTATSMGIGTVAVYAPSDAGAPFVAEADASVALTGAGAAGTYLDIEAIVAAARLSGADAVHPGYGFLSERAAFATAVIDAGLVWVGPPPAAIAAMGDKLAAKDLMSAAGVPVLTSHRVVPGDVPDVPVGDYPVLVKAAAGGGGKGMRVVADPAGLAEAVASAQREAQSAFGDPTVFVERYLVSARHIEIQVLADAHGHVVHAFERECSIQRRHQKIIEECPSPALSDATRTRMAAAALDAARAVGYRSAGTVEFVVDGDSGDFFFLEVNTRLQVEHPVTEAVTGLDLVREQLRVAEGHPLSVTQEDLRLDGHAVEARLYAEDPANDFLPATGTIVDWCPPATPAVRIDSGIAAGSVIGVEWDPMLAKVVAHAPTRAEAALVLASALERTRIRGVVTNRDYLVEVLRSEAFLAGATTTAFVDTVELPRKRQPAATELEVAAVAAAIAGQLQRRRRAPVLASLPSGWRNSVMPAPRVAFRHDGRTVTVTYRSQRDGGFDVRASATGDPDAPDATAGLAVVAGWDGARLDLDLRGVRRRFHVLDGDGVGAPGRVWVQGPSGDVVLDVVPRFPAPVTAEAGGALVSPMPGRVLSVHVEQGASVAVGDLLVVVEAMKMEHRVTAPHAGAVTEVRVAAGDQVAEGDVVVVIDPLEPAVAPAP
jgi:propionyl-CoA carboxylase alpha chain